MTGRAQFFAMLATLTHRLSRVALLVSAMGLVLMTLITGWQVFARYLLNDSPAWSETLSLLLMLYYIMLAAAVGVHQGFHLGLRIVIDAVSPTIRQYLDAANYALVALFGIAMLVNGGHLAQFTADHVIPTLNVSRSVAYWPFTMAGGLVTLFAVERLFITVAGHKQ